MTLSSVLLPQPDGPIRHEQLAATDVQEVSSKARTCVAALLAELVGDAADRMAMSAGAVEPVEEGVKTVSLTPYRYFGRKASV